MNTKNLLLNWSGTHGLCPQADPLPLLPLPPLSTLVSSSTPKEAVPPAQHLFQRRPNHPRRTNPRSRAALSQSVVVVASAARMSIATNIIVSCVILACECDTAIRRSIGRAIAPSTPPVHSQRSFICISRQNFRARLFATLLACIWPSTTNATWRKRMTNTRHHASWLTYADGDDVSQQRANFLSPRSRKLNRKDD